MESEKLNALKEELTRKESIVTTSNNRYHGVDNGTSPVEGRRNPRTTKLINKTWAERVPEHQRNLVYILRNNTEIRRYTALGIINYLLQKGAIKGEKRYVDFLWNKFSVKCDGIVHEYHYSEPFFLNCLIAAFTSFSASAQVTINRFCQKEFSSETNIVDNAVINDIVKKNEEHQKELYNSAE